MNKQSEIQRIKDKAEYYFNEGDDENALKEYENLKELNPMDLSGYYRYVNETKKLLSLDPPNCVVAKDYYQNYARKLHDLPNDEIDLFLNKNCK